MKINKQKFLEELVGMKWKHYKNQLYKNNEMEARYYFTNKRINQKYMQLMYKYQDIHLLDWNIMFTECLDLIIEILDGMNRNYIYISKKQKKDDISYIITTMEQRINHKINNWTGAYRDRSGGEDKIVSPGISIYLDEVIEYEEGRPVTRGETTSNDDVVTKQQKRDKELDNSLNKMYVDAKLTDREIEVLQALERTEDNYDNHKIYTKVDAAEILGTTGGTVRKAFSKIKNKVIKAYEGQVPQTRQETIKILENFLDNIEDEKNVISFIQDNLDEEFILYLLYDADIDSELVRYFNLNKNNESTYHTETMRKFCAYFLKETYNYIELLKYNDKMNKVKTLPLKPTYTSKAKSYEDFIDNTVYIYIREDKATEQQKQNRYITIDKEKYYFVDDEKLNNVKENIFF